MENQAFEEEHHSRIQEAATYSQQASSLPFRPRIDLFADLSVSSSDGHVYEDILPCVEEVSALSAASLVQDLARSSASALQRHLETLDCASREPTAKSPEQAELSTFRRNLTLPFRASAGLDPPAVGCSSVRVTSRERNSCPEEDAGDSGTPPEDALASREGQARAESGCRPNRRRRKKDCKHCRSKAAASAGGRVCDLEDREHRELMLGENQQPQLIVDPCNLGVLTAVRSPAGMAEGKELAGLGNDPAVFTISENVRGSPGNTLKLIEYERNDPGPIRGGNDAKALITPQKNRAGMRVNSIYSQDRWYAKEAPIFSSVGKEHGTFQRAYSLPARTQTPSSQNRANLRRSVRSEPPPHPARLHKHRRGWTLHLATPLEPSKRTRSLVLLLILMLTLLGIGGVALYIVFEPEKLQIIQQYLKSSANTSARHNTLSAGTFLSSPKSGQANDTSTATPASSGTLPASVALSDDQSLTDNSTGTPTLLETETEASGPSSSNSTRYCDDCLAEEVCVAIVDEPVPICRLGIDREDPTGCAGFCLINKQKCHRLDVDAFRCVEVEHYCLDDEWACSNTLCIPMEKRCDGHMNCYDHSDEYDCACDPETHFQCGNETSCLPLENRCDGKIDCWDAADEINCTLGRNLGRSCPMENEFTCSNGQCILKARFCDGLPDCLDGSDEPHGCQGRCNKHEFTCQNNRCIAKGMKCNGLDDCGDGTDERHCKDRFP